MLSPRGAPQVDAIRVLLELGADPTARDSEDSTPMHAAAGEGHVEAIQALAQLVRRGPFVAHPVRT